LTQNKTIKDSQNNILFRKILKIMVKALKIKKIKVLYGVALVSYILFFLLIYITKWS